MFYISQNWVKIAIDRLGGCTRSANAMNVSGTTIHNWIRKQRINSIERATQLAKLSGVKVQDLRPTL